MVCKYALVVFVRNDSTYNQRRPEKQPRDLPRQMQDDYTVITPIKTTPRMLSVYPSTSKSQLHHGD